MNGRPSISAYTPSNTDPELLKRIFVQREKLLERIINRMARSVTTGDKHHLLLVGPRGSGKTHLVSLAAWELQQREELSDVMRIAWLGEDDCFTGFIHLAFGIASQLFSEYPEEFTEDFRSPVRGLPPNDAARSVLDSVVVQLQHRNLILITENMDQTFRGLRDSGQKNWRAFLQESRKFATLATSQQLFAGVSDRKEAFFGFFDIQHLEPLSIDDARELISRISVEQDKPELVNYLNSAEGRFRIRALHYLAGGNHRMYVLLAEFLTKDSLDDLVEAFEHLAHDMTPYFQERLRSLPDQQRQLVQCLCDTEGALTVKGIAEETFIDERSCSKQLGNLKAKGYVRSEKRGKESYYDMAEPLMRLCLEVKNQHGKPLKMVARFLRAWFPATTLETVGGLEFGTERINEYRLEALRSGDLFQSALAGKLNVEFRETIEAERYESAKEIAEELQFADEFAALLANAELAFHEGNLEREIVNLTTLIKLPDAPPDQRAGALNNRGVTYGRQGKVELELSDYSAVIEMPDAPTDQRARALYNRGVMYGQQGKVELELSDYSAVIEMPDAPTDQRAGALNNRGVTYGRQGEFELALSDYSAVVEMPDAPTDQRAGALYNRGVMYGRQGEFELALSDYSAVIEMPDAPTEQRARALYNRGNIAFKKREFRASQADFDRVLKLSEVPSHVRTDALFAVPEPMIDHSSRAEVLRALARAFKEGDPQCDGYGGTPHDLLLMVLRQGPLEWTDYVSDIAALFIQFDFAEKLGQAVTKSIEYLDSGGYSESQLDAWNSAWQAAGQDREDLQIPLRCLDAAVEVMTSEPRTDRPLFQLPLEIRRLVRPLLEQSLGPAD